MNRFTHLSQSILSCALLVGMPLAVQAQVEDEHEHEAVEIHVSEELLEEFGVEFAVARPGRLEESLTLAGEIRSNADRLARIAPRYDGVITSVEAEIGDRVEAGQVLCKVEGDESLSEYELRTRIQGTVITKDAVLGEAVSRERVLFSVADLSQVWLDLTVHQRDLLRIAKGHEVEVFLGHDELKASGTISYISPVLDEATRTGIARVVLSNPDELWHLGMFVSARVNVGGWEVPVAVERDAVFKIGGETVVFVRGEGGSIEAREVHVGREGQQCVEILEGVHAGESYVHRGGFALKAELGKDRFGDGHGH